MEDDSAERVLSELEQLAKPGLRRRTGDLKLPLLDRAAKALSKYPDGSLERKLKDTLEKAADHLAEARRNAAAAILDFGPQPGPAKPVERRQAASEALGLASGSAFGKEKEKPLLEELAAQLARLLAEDEEPDAAALPRGAIEQSAAAPSQAPNQKIPSSSPTTWLGYRPYGWIVVTLAALAGIAGLALLIASSHPGRSLPERELMRVRSTEREKLHAILPGDCAKTTAERFDPPTAHTRRLLASSELYLYVPHQIAPETRHGWAHFLEYHNRSITHEVIHTAEAREFALSYHNYSNHRANEVIAIVVLPPGSELVPRSVCLYRHGDYAQGARYASPGLAENGQPIGDYAPGTSAYVTFWATLPSVRHLGCGLSEVTFAGMATAEPIEPGWAGNASDLVLNFERRCHS